MGGHSKRSCTSYEQLTQPVTLPHYHVSGVLNPDATGDYYPAGEINNHPYAKKENENWFLFFDYSLYGSYVIADNLVDFVNVWVTGTGDLLGEYFPEMPATGIATVTYVP